MVSYSIDSLKISGSDIVGPVPDMILGLELLFKNANFKNVLDLFCGTGALSKVALSLGSERVTAIDIDCKAAMRELNGTGAKIIEQDIFEWDVEEQYDLCIIDATYTLGYRVTKELMPKLVKCCNLIMLDVGLKEDEYWCNKILNEMQNFGIIVSKAFVESNICLLLENESDKWKRIWKE
jgi:16S rRNA G966 N2-methylase RsmD